MTSKQDQPTPALFVITRETAEQSGLLRDRVRVPEWDDQARQQSGNPHAEAVALIRELTAAERAKISKTMVATKGQTDVQVTFADFPKLQALIVCYGMIAEDGSQVFAERDADWLAAKSGKAVQRIAQAIQRLSGMMREQDELPAVVEQLGN